MFSDSRIGTVNGSELSLTSTGFVNYSSTVLTGNTPDPNSIRFVYGPKGDNSKVGNIFETSVWLNEFKKVKV